MRHSPRISWVVLLNLVMKVVDQPDRRSRTTRLGQACIQSIQAHQHQSHPKQAFQQEALYTVLLGRQELMTEDFDNESKLLFTPWFAATIVSMF